jgi:hypothetical protein
LQTGYWAGQDYVVNMRSAFTLEASLHCILVAAAYLNKLFTLYTGKIPTISRGFSLVCLGLANVHVQGCHQSVSESGGNKQSTELCTGQRTLITRHSICQSQHFQIQPSSKPPYPVRRRRLWKLSN